MAEQKKKGGKGGSEKVQTEYDDDFQHLVRISATDLPGTKKVVTALTGLKGIGIRLAPLVADKAGVDRNQKIGTLKDTEVQKLQEIVEGIGEEVPSWMRNRRRDYDSGEDVHLIGNEIELTLKDDINRLKKIRAYRGVRHENHLPVRGQRTRSNGRSGLTVGVQRKK